MNWLYIGNFNYEYNTEVQIANSLEALGHNVKRIQVGAISVAWLKETIMSGGYDVLLYSKTNDILGDWKWIGNNILTVSWCLDLYIGLQREAQLLWHPFWRNHIVITPDGGHQKEFKKYGINHYWVRAGVYDKECYYGKKDEGFNKEIVFVGSWRKYLPEWPYRLKLIQWLKQEYGELFSPYPTDGRIYGDKLNSLYASAKIVVGDSLYSPYYWSDRIYEVLGRGGFLIHPKIEGLEKEFVYGEHFVPYEYGNEKQLKDRINYYLKHDKEREEIRRCGHEFVKNNCTYIHRCKEVIEIIKNVRSKKT